MTQQCVNCPGAEDHSTAQCPLVSEQNKDAERAAFEAWRLEKFCAGVERLKKCSNAPDVYYYSAEQEAWKVWKARASLPVGVPDGYMPIPTAEQLADALENVRCFHDMSAELIAPELLANLLAAPTVKAEQGTTSDQYRAELYDEVWEKARDMGYGNVTDALVELERMKAAPSLPAAGSADQPYPDGIAEDLERSDWTPIEALQWYAAGKHFDVVDGRTRIIDTGAVASNALKHASLAYLELKGDAELSELRAALSAQQSAQGVSVPREFRKVSDKILSKLIRFADCAEDFEAGGVDIGRDWLDTLTHLGLLERVQRSPALWQTTDEADAIIEAQRALLNGGEA